MANRGEEAWPKVTILIPAYNQEAFVGKAIRSALDQDYGNLEVVVADDCSSDGTAERVSGYLSDPRLVFHRNSVNLGRVGNYRKCFYEYASGDWLLNLDGDDHLTDPSFVSASMDRLRRSGDEEIVLVVGGAVDVYVNGARHLRLPCRKDTVLGGCVSFARWPRRSSQHLAILYRRETVRSLPLFRREIVNADTEAVLKVMLEGKVLYVASVAGEWRGHEGNASSRFRSVREEMETIESFVREMSRYALEKGCDARQVRTFSKARYRGDYEDLLTKVSLSGSYRLMGEYFSALARADGKSLSIFLTPRNLAKILMMKFPFMLNPLQKMYFTVKRN